MTAGWRSAGEESSVDEEVDAAIRIARQLAVVPQDPANREEACEIFRRFGIKIGLSQRPDHALSSPTACLLPASRAPAAILCPAALRAGAALHPAW